MPGICKFIAKVRETGFIVNTPRRDHARTVLTPENIEALFDSVRESLINITHHRSHELNISRTSLLLNFEKDLGMTPYKVQSVQAKLKQSAAFSIR